MPLWFGNGKIYVLPPAPTCHPPLPPGLVPPVSSLQLRLVPSGGASSSAEHGWDSRLCPHVQVNYRDSMLEQLILEILSHFLDE